MRADSLFEAGNFIFEKKFRPKQNKKTIQKGHIKNINMIFLLFSKKQQTTQI